MRVQHYSHYSPHSAHHSHQLNKHFSQYGWLPVTAPCPAARQSRAGLRWLTAEEARDGLTDGPPLASPEVLDYIQLAEARRSAGHGTGHVVLDEKGGGYIYVLAEDRAVKRPNEALLEAAQLHKHGTGY